MDCYCYKTDTLAKAYVVLDHKVRQCPEMYLKLWFKKVKHLGVCEWQAECNGKTYILHRDCEYAAKLGAVYVRIVRDVASRYAVLVTRLYLDTGGTAYRWYWKEWHIVREGERMFRRECVKHYVEEQIVLDI